MLLRNGIIAAKRGTSRMNAPDTIGSAVITRLHQLGVRHIFGIPGDYVLSLYQLI